MTKKPEAVETVVAAMKPHRRRKLLIQIGVVVLVLGGLGAWVVHEMQ
ncbi:MAG: hypothetical protein ACYTDT_10065 [Planctomycetota bacterium]|jgi:hypothetical protein